MIQDVKLREADEKECLAGGYGSGAIALEDSIQASDIYFEAHRNGKIVAWFGCKATSFLGTSALVWMLSTPEIENHKMFAARDSIQFTYRFLQLYPTLLAYVHTEHSLSRRWLTWLGFRDIRADGAFVWMALEKKDWQWGS